MQCTQCRSDNAPEAKFCNQCGAALSGALASVSPEIAARTEGERRHLTVLFCDLVGSTEIAARLDPEQWHEIGAQYQRTAANAAIALGGYVAKYLGDGLVVYFGYPDALEDASERAVRAGLAIIETMAALNARFATEYQVKLSVRVGIHTGSVVVARGGGKEADMFGDAPNIASRVQGVAAPDTVVITAAVHDLVSGRFVVEDRGTQLLKGIEQPVQLYRVLAPGVAPRRTHGVAARKLTPFIGRDGEMHVLLSRWQRAREGHGQFVLIGGEPGIGKSRLLEEFHTLVKADLHLWVECAGEQLFKNTPFRAVAQMLNQGLGWRGGESKEERVARLERALDGASLKRDEAVPLIAGLLDLPVPQNYPPLTLSPDQKRQALLAALAEWVRSAARSQPIVIAIEDLHWIDPSTIELMQSLVDLAVGAPLMIVGTARPEFEPPWSPQPHHAKIELNRLNDNQTREMVAGIAPGTGPLKDLIDTIVDRTDGVPLFVEELARALLENTGRAGKREIPASLHDLLTARLDRLGRAKEVAQIGAVLGREFSHDLLSAVARLPGDELQAALKRLADAELIEARDTPTSATYRFKHALIQDAAYEALLKSKRRELHARVAQTMQESFPALAGAQPEVLARHWSDAGEADKAVTAWTDAATTMSARYAYKEALQSYRQALTMLATLPETPERDTRELGLIVPLGSIMGVLRGYNTPEYMENSERGAALAERSGSLQQLVLQLMLRFASVWMSGQLAKSLALPDQLLDLAQREGSGASLRVAHLAKMVGHNCVGDIVAAEQHFLQWSRYQSAPSGLLGETMAVLAVAAEGAYYLGYPDLARRRTAHAVAIARQKQNPVDLTMALMIEAWLCVLLREHAGAASAAAEAFAIAEERSLPQVNQLRVCLAWARANLGSAAQAIPLIEQSLPGWLGGGVPRLIEARRALAEVLALAGATDKALAVFDEVCETRIDNVVLQAAHLICRGELRQKLHRSDGAKADFEAAVAIAHKQGAKALELRASTGLARLLHARGDAAAARERLTPLYAWFTEGFDTVDLKEAKALIDACA